MISWLLSKLFPYKLGAAKRTKEDADPWSIRKAKENEKEYGGYNLKDRS